MKAKFGLTIIFFFFFDLSFGQIVGRGHASKDYYVDGFKVYTKLSESDSLKVLKDMVAQLNGDWTSTEKFGPTITKYTWTYKLNETMFKGWVFNPELILAAPTVKLEIINGLIKIIYYRSIGETLIPDNSFNIKIIADELTIGDSVYKRLK